MEEKVQVSYEISSFETLKVYTEKSSIMGIAFRSFQLSFHPIVHKMYLSGNIGISKNEVSQDPMINVINIEFKINLLIKVFMISMEKSSQKQRNHKWGRRTKFAVQSLHRAFTFSSWQNLLRKYLRLPNQKLLYCWHSVFPEDFWKNRYSR